MSQKKAPRALVPLAKGFEEIEATAIVDVLRRGGVEVVLAGLEAGPVQGAHGIALATDAELGDLDPLDFDLIALPGGMPGTTHLMQDERVLDAVRRLHEKGRITAAVCAAPMVLERAGILDGVPVTSHPSVRSDLGSAVVRDAPRVIRSGAIVTSQGPGTAIEFALELVRELCGAERAAQLAQAMLVRA